MQEPYTGCPGNLPVDIAVMLCSYPKKEPNDYEQNAECAQRYNKQQPHSIPYLRPIGSPISYSELSDIVSRGKLILGPAFER
jgi:hypothetical protein